MDGIIVIKLLISRVQLLDIKYKTYITRILNFQSNVLVR